MAITLTSDAFTAHGPIPQQYTGEGADVSPPLAWSGVPQGAKELALICEDPDAPTAEPWVHWVIYKIPPMLSGLPEGVRSDLTAGQNDFNQTGYRGPMPPPGHGMHQYHFHLYALDVSLLASPGLTKSQLLDAMQGHILAEGELVGAYERR
jgi:Raf kinase inhibitor-like YbhB/YbcL family protein